MSHLVSEHLVSEHGALPLAPVDRPRALWIRAIFAATRRRYGRVPTAFRVLFSRSPYLALVSIVLVTGLERFLRIPRELRFLLQISIASRADCTFCRDILLAEAVRARIGRERFRDLLDFETSGAFTEREKAALAYARALHDSPRIPDEVWARLGSCFDERERVDIVWVCAVERYYNSMALPLRIGSDGFSAAPS